MKKEGRKFNNPVGVEHYQNWEKILRGDRELFRQTTDPYLKELLQSAQREIAYQCSLQNLERDDLSPEELVGETLIRAWRFRSRRPENMSLKGWLLAIQRRRLQQIVQQEKEFRGRIAISLESSVPKEPESSEEAFYGDWYQPDDFNRWEDLIPDDFPTPEVLAEAHEELIHGAEDDERDAFYLYHEHQLPVQEVATVIQRTVRQTVSLLQAGTATYHRVHVSRKEEIHAS